MAEQDGDLLTEGMEQSESTGTADNPASGGSEGTSESSVTERSDGDIPKFHSGLRGDLKGHERLMKFDNPSDLAQSYIDLEEKLGRSIEIPGDDASEDERSRFYAQLGRPETQDGYTFDEVEGVEMTEEALGEFKAKAYELGLTQAQANELFKHQGTQVQTAAAAIKNALETRRADAEKSLQDAWKGDYDVNMSTARKALERFASPEFVKFLQSTGLGNHPAMSETFHQIGVAISEGSAPLGGSGKEESKTPDGFFFSGARDFTASKK